MERKCQCSGSVTFWYGSGSRDPYIWLTDSDPGPNSAFRHWPSRRQQKRIFPYYFLKVHLHSFEKIKIHKEVTKEYESRFFLLFLLDDGMIRIPYLWLTDPKSKRPKNLYWIRIRNTCEIILRKNKDGRETE
jgi:hypothetical protein